MALPHNVVFDIGNVLIEWSPRHLYAKLFEGRDAALEWFLDTVCTAAWNLEADRGRTWREGVITLRRIFPEWRREIEAYDERWHEMVPGAIEASVALLTRLKSTGVRLFAITNFSVEKLAECRVRFGFLDLFEDIVVSAVEGVVKPDPAIFRRLLARQALEPEGCVFIDDMPANVAAAKALGMHAITFTDGAALSAELRHLGFAV